MGRKRSSENHGGPKTDYLLINKDIYVTINAIEMTRPNANRKNLCGLIQNQKEWRTHRLN